MELRKIRSSRKLKIVFFRFFVQKKSRFLILEESSLIPVLEYFLNNDSFLDMSKHQSLYTALFNVVRALAENDEYFRFLIHSFILLFILTYKMISIFFLTSLTTVHFFFQTIALFHYLPHSLIRKNLSMNC